jgi:hypothetical protein
MNGVAHISFAGGSCFLPTDTPYEREVLFDFLRQSANRHGHARLALNQQGWVISQRGRTQQRCASCHGWLQAVTYARGGRALCTRCARRDIP